MTADSKRSQVEKLISQNGDFGTLALPQLPVSVSNGTEKSQSAQMRMGWGRGASESSGRKTGRGNVADPISTTEQINGKN